MTLEGRVRSVLLLQPRGGDYAALVEFFKQQDILGLAMREAGCLTAELQVPESGSGPVVVTAVWESPEAYAGWRNHPVRARFSGDMDRLTEPDPQPVQGGVYRIAVALSALATM
jgi:heme-degrading monooxygenase HmoA